MTRPSLAQRHNEQVLWLARIFATVGVAVSGGCLAMFDGRFAGIAISFVGPLLCAISLTSRGLSKLSFGMGEFTASMRREKR